MTDQTVTISAKEYIRLVSAELRLDALDAAGVDNWEGSEHVDWAGVEAGIAAAEARVAGSQETTGATA